MGPSITQNELLNAYVILMKDTEAEVRTAAVLRLTDVAKRVPPQLVIAKLIPCLRELVISMKDPSQHVRGLLLRTSEVLNVLSWNCWSYYWSCSNSWQS